MTLLLSEYVGYVVKYQDGLYYRDRRTTKGLLQAATVFIRREDADALCGVDGTVERIVDRTTRETFPLS